MASLWKRLPTSTRLLLRLVRGIERLAVAVEGIRDAQYIAHGVPIAVTPTTDDTPDDDGVQYSTDRSTFEHQEHERRRREAGFPVSEPVTPPRH